MKWTGILLLVCLSWAAETETEQSQEKIETLPAEEKEQDTQKIATAEATVEKEVTVETTENNSTVGVCKAISDTLGTTLIKQNCTVHQDCRGALCRTQILAHNITYNFTVMPCHDPSVQLVFNMTDLTGAYINNSINSTGQFNVPGGNMSYQGWFETASNVQVKLETVLDITHFRLDFSLEYKVLETDVLKELFLHTLVPTLSIDYSEDLCEKPEESEADADDEDKYFGVIPKEYVKDKKTLALIATSATLAVIVIIVGIYCVISKRRNSDHFYRTYVSTDENRHLTKGNDGFEPLDDSDID